jgi:hypothetical protein
MTSGLRLRPLVTLAAALASATGCHAGESGRPSPRSEPHPAHPGVRRAATGDCGRAAAPAPSATASAACARRGSVCRLSVGSHCLRGSRRMPHLSRRSDGLHPGGEARVGPVRRRRRRARLAPRPATPRRSRRQRTLPVSPTPRGTTARRRRGGAPRRRPALLDRGKSARDPRGVRARARVTWASCRVDRRPRRGGRARPRQSRWVRRRRRPRLHGRPRRPGEIQDRGGRGRARLEGEAGGRMAIPGPVLGLYHLGSLLYVARGAHVSRVRRQRTEVPLARREQVHPRVDRDRVLHRRRSGLGLPHRALRAAGRRGWRCGPGRFFAPSAPRPRRRAGARRAVRRAGAGAIEASAPRHASWS